MALTPLTENLNVHQSLPDQPALSATELKQKFDEAAGLIKEYINESLLPELNTIISTLEGNDTTVEIAISAIQTTLGNAVSDISSINTDYTSFKNSTTNSIGTINSTLSTLKSGATTKITIGTSVPSSLANGEVYLQYF